MRCLETPITEPTHEVSLRNPTSKRTANERKRTANDPSATSQRKNAILRFHLCYQGLQT